MYVHVWAKLSLTTKWAKEYGLCKDLRGVVAMIADTSWFYDEYHLIDPIIHCISMSNKLLLSQIVNKCYVLLFVSYHQYKKII